MLRALALVTTLALVGSAAHAQATTGRPILLVAGGVAGQYDGDRDLGSPGWSAAVGLEWPVARTVGVRLEAQGMGYGEQVRPAVLDARQASAERLGAASALLSWSSSAAERSRAPYLVAGGALVQARLAGEDGTVRTGAAVVGLGVRLIRSAGIEVQYLHAARPLGETRSAIAGRLQLRF